MTTSEEQIAIIGMSGRFPGADDVEQFWKNLVQGVESTTRFSERELLDAGVDPVLVRSPEYVRSRPALAQPDFFDAEFFGYSAREAEWIDPQHRVLLECSWEAFERAGYDPTAYKGWVGVFAGASINIYMLHNLGATRDRLEQPDGFELVIASEKDYAATRIAYKLNLKGPAITVQSACSTALVAVHQACQSLLSGECDMALAGGASIDFPSAGYRYQPEGVRSPDGRCRPFDSQANGCMFGDAAGMVLLKRLADAERDGDPILAVILGSATNNDGNAKVGFTAPSLEGQARVVAMAHIAAGVRAESIGYVEAHGTATPIGDPIEIAALTKAFRRHTDGRGFCAIGSVKANVGHTSTAAGVVSLIKAVNVVREGQIPASLHFRKPNPKIQFEDTPFFVNDQLRSWPENEAPRRAGVSAFGIGGTNAHVVIEGPPDAAPRPAAVRRDELLVLSARSASAVNAAVRRLGAQLRSHPELRLDDVAATLQSGRRHFEHRASVVCSSTAEAQQLIERTEALTVTRCSRAAPRVVFLFTGQGTQYPGAARELYVAETSFRDALDSCAETLKRWLHVDIRSVLLPPPGAHPESARETLNRMDYAQAGVFSVQYALCRLFESWGLVPGAVLGHSLGEIAAACVAGVFSLQHALELVARRGQLMQAQPPGAMLAVPLDAAELEASLPDALDLAVVNAPGMCVVSGPELALADYQRTLVASGVEPRRVHVPRAAHSRWMAPVAEALFELVSGFALGPAKLPFLSSLRGDWLGPSELASAAYWAEHVTSRVRFASAVANLGDASENVLLEIGAGRTLCSLAELQHAAWLGRTVSSLPSAKDSADARRSALSALGALWEHGVPLDWSRTFGATTGRRVVLPTYAFERKKLSVAVPRVAAAAAETQTRPYDRWFATPGVRASALPLTRDIAFTPGKRWVVLRGPDCAVGQAVEARLERAEQVVFSAVTSAAGGGADFVLDRQNAEARLFERLGALDIGIDYWIDCRPLSRALDGANADMGVPGFASVVETARGLSNLPPLDRKLCVLAARALSGDVDPGAAALFAAYHSLAYEVPGLLVRLIDVAPSNDPEERSALIGAVLADLVGNNTEPRLALRRERRWLPSLEPLELGPATPSSSRLRRGGTYVITGGLNGIGWELAQHLASAWHANLVLLGRRAFPAREDWQSYKRSAWPEPEIAERIGTIEALERSGARFLILTANVACEQELSAAFARALAEFGSIDGAFHSAGVASEGLIATKQLDDIECVMAPKIRGSEQLYSLLQASNARFLLAFSSSIALLGGPGQVDYGAANQYLGAFADARASGPEVLTIYWGAWKEAGIAARRGLAARAPLGPGQPFRGRGPHPLLELEVAGGTERRFIKPLNAFHDWFLSEHRIGDTAVVPGTAYVAQAHAALQRSAPGGTSIELRDLEFLELCRVADGERVELVVEVEDRGTERVLRFLRVELDPSGSIARQTLVARCRAHTAAATAARFDVSELRRRAVATDPERLFQRVNESGLVRWGPRWRCLRELSFDGDEALARLELEASFCADVAHYAVHPALLDVATAIAGLFGERRVYFPAGYARVVIHGALPAELWVHVRRREPLREGSRELCCDVTLADAQGRTVLEIEGYRLAPGPVPVPERDTNAITPREGIEAIERILAHSGFRQVVVSPRDLSAELVRQKPLAVAFAKDGAGSEAAPDSGELDIRQRALRIWRDVLGLQSVDESATFFELGGHSLMALQLQAKLYQAFGVQIPVRDLFASPTLAGLVARIEAAHAECTAASA